MTIPIITVENNKGIFNIPRDNPAAKASIDVAIHVLRGGGRESGESRRPASHRASAGAYAGGGEL